MANTRDQMQDVFPIVFNFVKGEQPTAEKLTGLVKHTDTAFSQVTQGIGDPWDYASHDDGTGSRLNLSLENLGQSSLARIIGSSDWLSPMGGCWNESGSSKTVTLQSYRNSWTLGFPLVTLSSAINKTSGSSVATAMTWAGNVTVVTDVDGVLTTEVATAQDVDGDGDFFVDYLKGTIISYERPTSNVVLRITGLYMFGLGAPWATHNLIPHWNQTIPLCNVSLPTSTATTSTYILTLPIVSGASRLTTSSVKSFGRRSNTLSTTGDTTWSTNYCGEGSNYRLPSALTTSNLSSGDLIPEGYCLLWQGDRDGRVIPQVTFYYRNANSLTLETPLNWLIPGDNYRLIVSGASTADNINYLMQIARNNEHVGLTENPTISYTVPLSHKNLENRFADEISATYTSTIERWQFRESTYPTNQHPQYLHRGGYMENDLTGNSGNAMRGDLVLGGNDASLTYPYPVGDGDTPATASQSSALAFGGGNTLLEDYTANTFIRLDGTRDDVTWSAGDGHAERSLFNLDNTGTGSARFTGLTDTDALGSLSLVPWRGTPLYLRGYYPAGGYEKKDHGAILGFDMAHRREANHIRLVRVDRDTTAPSSAYNMPADIGQSASATLDITPGFDEVSYPGTQTRFCVQQLREFRFRGVPYVSSSTNVNDSLGGSNWRTGGQSTIAEFQKYFVSPGVVGADFLNVYSNAIFFSDTGDGNLSSLTTNGEDWLNDGTTTKTPSGIYYAPYTSSQDPHFYISVMGSSTSTQPFSVGSDYGLKYSDDDGKVIFHTGSTSAIRNNYYSTYLYTRYGIGNVLADYSDSKNGIALYSKTGDIRIVTSGAYWCGNYTSDSVSQKCITIGTNSNITNDTSGTTFEDTVFLLADSVLTMGEGSTYSYTDNIIIAAGKDITFGDTPTYTYGNQSLSKELWLCSGDDIRMYADDNILIETTGTVSGGDITLTSNDDITITAYGMLNLTGYTQDVNITAGEDVDITAGAAAKIRFYTSKAGNPNRLLRIRADLGPYANDVTLDTTAGGLHLESSSYILSETILNYSASDEVVGMTSAGVLGKWSSSIRDKKDVLSLHDVNWIYNIRPVSFLYKNNDDPQKIQYGFIAEEVEKINKELINYREDGKVSSVKYFSILGALTKAVQDQKKQIEELKLKLAGMI